MAGAAGPRRSGSLGLPPAGFVSGLGAALSLSLAREFEQRRFFPWLATSFAAGAALYFAVPREPPLLVLGPAALVLSALAWRGWRSGGAWRLVLIAAMLVAGASAAAIRVAGLVGPEIARPFAADVTGRVVDLEDRPERRPRVVLADAAIADADPERVPRRLRLSLAPDAPLPPIGATIALRARLMPVSGPAVPGAYDPHRAAFFDGIGGTGFALGGWRLEDGAATGPASGTRIRAIRNSVVEEVLAATPGSSGAIAAALLVGERSHIPESVAEDLRLSGLAHVLSISGLHMMLIAGTAFFTIRAALALSYRLALTAPIRKWAAAAALVAASAYMLLSGGGAATTRAFVMAAIMFTAILVDRPAISMRNLALALFVVVALEPEGIVEPGLQMSFAAVAALIAAWEAWRDRTRLRLADADAGRGSVLLRLAGRALFATALTTLVAGLATAPIGAFHFERIAAYSLLGNLLAMPLVSFVIMPAALAVLVLMPFGLADLPILVMTSGIDGLLAIAHWVAGLSGADIRAPEVGAAALLVMSAGFLWLVLWTERWRLLGLAPIALGIGLAPALYRPADLMVTADAAALAFRAPDGALRLVGTRPGSFVADQFLEKERAIPDPPRLGQGLACDRLGCTAAGPAGAILAYVEHPRAFAEDCRRAAILVTPLIAPPDCSARLVVDARALAGTGAVSIRLRSDGSAIVKGEWSLRPRPWQKPPQFPL